MIETDDTSSYNLQIEFEEIKNNLGLVLTKSTVIPIKCDSEVLTNEAPPLISLFEYKKHPISPSSSNDGSIIRDYSREVKLSYDCYKFQQSLSLNESSLLLLNQEIKDLKIKNKEIKEELKIKNKEYDESLKEYIYKEKTIVKTMKELENDNKMLNEKLKEINKESSTTKRNIIASLIRTKELNRRLELKIIKLNSDITDMNNINDKDQSNLNNKIKKLILQLNTSKNETIKWKSNFEDIYIQLKGIEPIISIIPGLNKEIKYLKKELNEMKIENYDITQNNNKCMNECTDSKKKLEDFLEKTRQTYEDNNILEEKVKRLFKERSCLLSYLLCEGIQVPQNYLQELEYGNVIEEEFDNSNDDND